MDVKRQPTISICNMGRLLGLKKVESYWLVHKGYFETILVNGKMRVVMESFEHWYAGQIKYHKVNGEPPGERLRQESYSARDIAEMLEINEKYAYSVMKAAGIKPIIVDYWQRFPKEAFDEWYAGQNRFRTKADRDRDAEIEEASMSMPDMARLLDVPRSAVYHILKGPGKDYLEVITVADRKRITRASFNRWYYSQTEYLKPEDQPKGIPRKRRSYADSLTGKRPDALKKQQEIHKSENPDFLTVEEASILLETTSQTVRKWIKIGILPASRISRTVVRIPKTELKAFLEKDSRKAGKKKWRRS